MSLHGVVVNHLGNVVLEGATGRARIDQIMASFRTDPPRHLGDLSVIGVTDRQDPDGEGGPHLSETDKTSRNQLSFQLENGGRMVLRPSGTEPKLKIYIELTAPPSPQAQRVRNVLKHDADHLHQAVVVEMLERIDINMPPWAFDIDDSVNLDTKIEWATKIVPALLEKLEMEPDTAFEWLQRALDSDSRALLKPGILSLINSLGIEHPALHACFEKTSEATPSD